MANTKGKAAKGPKLAVELPVEMQKKTFNLKAPTAAMLGRYTAFLSEHHGQRIDEDRVLESLISELEKDRAFMRWQGGASNA